MFFTFAASERDFISAFRRRRAPWRRRRQFNSGANRPTTCPRHTQLVSTLDELPHSPVSVRCGWFRVVTQFSPSYHRPEFKCCRHSWRLEQDHDSDQNACHRTPRGILPLVRSVRSNQHSVPEVIRIRTEEADAKEPIMCAKTVPATGDHFHQPRVGFSSSNLR